MASNGKAIDAPRGEFYKMDPSDIVILGVDVGEFDNDADKARMAKPEIDDGFVASIISFGVIQSISIAKHSNGTYRVVDGRRRVLGARAANARIAKEGRTAEFIAEFGEGIEPVRVPSIVTRATPDKLAALAALGNSGKLPETLIQKAERCKAMMATLPASLPEADKLQRMAHAFAVSVTAIRQWLSLDEASAGVKRALDAGQINATTAIKLIKGAETKSDQDAALAELVSSGEKVTSGKAATAAAKTKRKDDPNKEPLPAGAPLSKRKLGVALKRIRENALRIPTSDREIVEQVLEFAMGSDMAAYPESDKILRMLLGKE